MTRTNFDNRREGTSFTYEYEGMECHVVVNRFAINEIGELFLDAGKPGSSAHSMGKEGSVLFSLARSYGCPLGVILAALPRLVDGSAAGPIGRALEIAEGTL